MRSFALLLALCACSRPAVQVFTGDAGIATEAEAPRPSTPPGAWALSNWRKSTFTSGTADCLSVPGAHPNPPSDTSACKAEQMPSFFFCPDGWTVQLVDPHWNAGLAEGAQARRTYLGSAGDKCELVEHGDAR